MNTTELYEWLRWRLREAVDERQGDFASVSHGGAGYDEGERAGVERTLRDVIDMVESMIDG